MKRRNFKNSLVLDQQRAKELASKRAEVKARRALQSNGGNGNGKVVHSTGRKMENDNV
jgi:hypothetical protein